MCVRILLLQSFDATLLKDELAKKLKANLLELQKKGNEVVLARFNLMVDSPDDQLTAAAAAAVMDGAKSLAVSVLEDEATYSSTIAVAVALEIEVNTKGQSSMSKQASQEMYAVTDGRKGYELLDKGGQVVEACVWRDEVVNPVSLACRVKDGASHNSKFISASRDRLVAVILPLTFPLNKSVGDLFRSEVKKDEVKKMPHEERAAIKLQVEAKIAADEKDKKEKSTVKDVLAKVQEALELAVEPRLPPVIEYLEDHYRAVRGVSLSMLQVDAKKSRKTTGMHMYPRASWGFKLWSAVDKLHPVRHVNMQGDARECVGARDARR